MSAQCAVREDEGRVSRLYRPMQVSVTWKLHDCSKLKSKMCLFPVTLCHAKRITSSFLTTSELTACHAERPACCVTRCRESACSLLEVAHTKT